MPTEVERISDKIARSPSFDGYSLWRILKEINNQIFELQRMRSPVPIELGRLRAIIVRAQELRRKSGWLQCTAASADEVRIDVLAAAGLDPFDVVDRCRSLVASRVALDIGRGPRRDRSLARHCAALGGGECDAPAELLPLADGRLTSPGAENR